MSSQCKNTKRGVRIARLFCHRGFYLLLALTPLVLFAVSLIVVNTPWFKSRLEKKLEARFSGDWELGRLGFFPAKGFSISSLEMKKPAFINEKKDGVKEDRTSLRIQNIYVKPYWRECLAGDVAFQQVTLGSSSGVVSVEFIADILAQIKTPQPEVKQKPKSKQKPKKKKLTPAKTKKPSQKEKGPKKATKEIEKPQIKEEVRPPAGLATKLLLQQADFKIVSESKGLTLFHVSGVSVDTTIFGEDSEGILKADSVLIPGVAGLKAVEQKIVWKRPFLEIEGNHLNTSGIKAGYSAKLGLAQKGGNRFPFQVALQLPSQKLKGIEGFEKYAFQVSSEQVEANFLLAGHLKSPSSWRGRFIANAKNLTVKEFHGGHTVKFDSVFAPALISNGRLRWDKVSFVGEDISILGNGELSAQAGCNAVVRLVASPELALAVQKGLIGSRIMQGHKGWWRNLDTPDRKVRDLIVSGSVINPSISMGTRRMPKELSLQQLVKTVMDFIKLEMEEEGKVLQPIINDEMLNAERYENH